MPEQDSETKKQPTPESGLTHPLGPTEELLAREQAEQKPEGSILKPEAESEQPAGWLNAPQQEGILSHPTPDTSPASPGKEQHQQAVAEETREPGGGTKKISTRTELGCVVTLDGIYSVPRYTTTVKEEPPSQSRGRDFTREQNSRQQARGQDRERER